LVLTEGDLDEIGDVVCNATETIWGHIEDQGLKELQVQIGVIHASMEQESAGKSSVPSVSTVKLTSGPFLVPLLLRVETP